MRLLLDTHTAICWMTNAQRLSERAADEIIDESNEVLLSAAVIWEVAVKRSLGKLQAPMDLSELMVEAGARALPISHAHAAAVEDLPPLHRDPFDRLLVAQAQIERATLVSDDDALRRYDVELLW